MRKAILVLCWLLQTNIRAQTKVDLRTQGKAVDFSQAAATQPAKKGTTLPSTCVAGEVFFKTDAAAGQNLYLCTASNTWTAGNAGGTVTHTAGALAAGKIVVGNGSGDAKTSGVGIDASNNISTSGTLSTTGVASLSLALNGSSSGTVTQTTAAAAGTWSFTWPTSAGNNLMFLQTDGSGAATWANPAFTNIGGTVGNAQLGANVVRTDQANAYSTGAQDFSAAASTVPSKSGASDPASCGAGEQFYNTTSNKLKVCTASNTWTDYSPGGTVTHTGALDANAAIVGNSSGDVKKSSVTIDSSGNISTPGTFTTAGSGSGKLKLSGSTSGTVTQTVNAVAGTWTWTWPATAGSNGQVLKTDGSGVMSWAADNDGCPGGGCAGGGSADVGLPTVEGGSFRVFAYPLSVDMTTPPAALANSTAETSIIGTFTGNGTAKGNSLRPGATIQILAGGTLGTTGTPTLTFKVKLGSVTMATIAPVLTSGLSGDGWQLSYRFTIDSLTTAQGHGCFQGIDPATILACASAQASGLDFTADQALDVTATWSAMSSSDTLTTRFFTARIL